MDEECREYVFLGFCDQLHLTLMRVIGVVDDARMNFGSSPSPPLVENEAPPLSPPPGRLSSSQTRSHRSARLPRRVLAANQIFADGAEKGLSPNSSYVTSGYTSPAPSSTGPSSPGLDVPVIYTPSKQRQEASSSSDPQPSALGTPLRRREKSRSHADLLGMEINPMGTVDLDCKLFLSCQLSNAYNTSTFSSFQDLLTSTVTPAGPEDVHYDTQAVSGIDSQ